MRVSGTLTLFQKCTVQLLSQSKFSLLISEACPTQVRDGIKIILGVELDTFESKYLGFPSPEQRMKNERFQQLWIDLGRDVTKMFMS